MSPPCVLNHLFSNISNLEAKTVTYLHVHSRESMIPGYRLPILDILCLHLQEKALIYQI